MSLYDHIDLRAPRLEDVETFYRRLLPALGFTEEVRVDGWLQFCAPGEPPTEFFGVTASEDFRPNENRIAFRAPTRERLYALGPLLHEIGAREIDGPAFYEAPEYHAVFFLDPVGNPLEICHRIAN